MLPSFPETCRPRRSLTSHDLGISLSCRGDPDYAGPVLEKPGEIVGRGREWDILSRFLREHPTPDRGAAIVAVTGRRRTGKSHLLSRFAELTGGLYYEASQEDTLTEAQERLRDLIAEYEPARASDVIAIGIGECDTWERLLELAMDLTFARGTADLIPPVIIDEFPYLLRDTPKFQSILHQLYDTRHFRPGEIASPGVRIGYYNRLIEGRLLLCGSAMSVMHELGHGSRPLFGRLTRTMSILPFDHIDMACFWGIENHAVALRLYAALGGAPGYRAPLQQMAGFGPPRTPEEFDTWITAAALGDHLNFFTDDETRHLLREDPRAGDKAIYQDAMKAIAGGATTVAQIGGELGASKDEVEPVVDRLIAMGYVEERREFIPRRNLHLRLRDPIIRFHHAVVAPVMESLRLGTADPATIWEHSGQRFRSQVLGPAFEEVVNASAARIFLDRGFEVGNYGWTIVPDPATRKNHEVDLVGVAPYTNASATGSQITVIGESKATERPRGRKDLERLRHIRDLLTKRHRAENARLAIFSMYGFSDALQKEASDHPDEVILVGLDDLYTWK